MHSLDPIPFAQLSDVTAQYLLRRYLLQPGIKLLHSWHTALLLNSNTPSVNCLFSILSCFRLSSLVKLCAERCFMTNSKPQGSALIHQGKKAVMWTALKWFIFLSSSTTQPLLQLTRWEKGQISEHGAAEGKLWIGAGLSNFILTNLFSIN